MQPTRVALVGQRADVAAASLADFGMVKHTFERQRDCCIVEVIDEYDTACEVLQRCYWERLRQLCGAMGVSASIKGQEQD